MMVYTHEKEGSVKDALSRAMTHNDPKFQKINKKEAIQRLGKEKLVHMLKEMLRVRNFEMRAEAAYQQGEIGGFFHAYIGQEAIQTACIDVFGKENWFSASYRCHAIALLLGVSPNDVMSELFGRANGNAFGRGGSMHLYSERLLGGFGIVAGQTPIAIGAALSIKHQKKDDEVSFCFLGDGAVAQGVFYESVNIAALWDLPCIFVVENNKWGMGTAVSRAVALDPIGQNIGQAFNLDVFELNGMDLIEAYVTFEKINETMKKNRKPIIVEAITERFRGHSISDPGLYRSKESLKEIMSHDVLLNLKADLIEVGFITEDEYKAFDKEAKEIAIQSIEHAKNSPWPDPVVLEEDVLKEDE